MRFAPPCPFCGQKDPDCWFCAGAPIFLYEDTLHFFTPNNGVPPGEESRKKVAELGCAIDMVCPGCYVLGRVRRLPNRDEELLTTYLALWEAEGSAPLWVPPGKIDFSSIDKELLGKIPSEFLWSLQRMIWILQSIEASAREVHVRTHERAETGGEEPTEE